MEDLKHLRGEKKNAAAVKTAIQKVITSNATETSNGENRLVKLNGKESDEDIRALGKVAIPKNTTYDIVANYGANGLIDEIDIYTAGTTDFPDKLK